MKGCLTGSQLRSQLRSVLHRHPEARFFGYLCEGGYEGPDQVQVGELQVAVVATAAPLAAHELALRHDPVVLLWMADSRLLSDDVRERLAGGKLRRPDVWEAVRDMFRAQAVDPRLRARPEVARYLLESEPVAGYPATPDGLLTAEFAWEQLMVHRLGLHPDSHDVRQLLRWATSAQTDLLPGAPPELLGLTRDWLRERGGPLLDWLFPLARQPLDLIALGVVCDVLYLGPDTPATLVARTRLERLLEDRPLPPTFGSAWAQLTAELFKPLEAVRPAWVRPVLERAQDVLTELGAEELTERSLLLPRSFSLRLARFGSTLEASDLTAAQKELDALAEHLDAGPRQDELARAEMALRLARYLAAPEPSPRPELAWWAQDYLQRVAFVDLARVALQGGDYRPLTERVLERRERFNESFARALQGWHEAGASGTELLLGQQFLEEVVAPLVREKRVLLLVLDGCSQVTLRELAADLAQRSWSSFRAEEPRWSRLLAALPSVTAWSRTTLLTGVAQEGNQTVEKSGFSSHPALLAVCTKKRPPRLFHKGDLGGDTVRDAILDTDSRLVGLVINSIDDTLAKDEQLKLSWTSDLIVPLHKHLRHALEADRVVLVVSDHGHLLDDGMRQLPSANAGSRWAPGSHAEEGEVLFSGNLRMLWTERARYGPRKRGYHGGASPQEMLCSLALFAPPGTKVLGWCEGLLPAPPWWEAEREMDGAGREQLDLFEQATVSTVWEQLAQHPATREVVKRQGSGLQPVLRALVSCGGGASVSQLAEMVGLAEASLRLPLQVWLRQLKVEGKPVLVLSADAERLTLDLAPLGG